MDDGASAAGPGEPTSLELARREIETLERALVSRTVIGQAIGIVMIEKGLTAEAAFDHLVTVSSRRNVKVREVAASLVEEANLRADQP